MKKHFKLAALLLAMLLVVSSAFAEFNPTIDSAAYENAVSTAEADSSVSYNWLYESMITFLSGKTREERLAYLNGTESWGQIGHFVVGELQAYYAAKYPEGDLICTCAALCGFGDALHASKCPWYPEQLPTEEQTTTVTAEDGTQISVAGNLPVGVELSVETATLADVAALAPELEGLTAKHKVFDISMLQANAEAWQPGEENPVEVTMDVADFVGNNDRVLIYHVHENEDGTATTEVIGREHVDNGQITFTMSKFSYVIVINNNVTISDIQSFYTVSGTSTNDHIVAKGLYFTSTGDAHLMLLANQSQGADCYASTITIGDQVISGRTNADTENYSNVSSFTIKDGEIESDVTDLLTGHPFKSNDKLYIIDINLGSDFELTGNFNVSVVWNDGSIGGFAIDGMAVAIAFDNGILKSVTSINGETNTLLSPEVNVGNEIVYSLEVKNGEKSTQAASGKVYDQLPANIFDLNDIYFSTDGTNWTKAVVDENRTFTLEENLTLQKGETKTYYVKATVLEGTAAGQYFNTAYFGTKSSAVMVRVSEKVKINVVKVWEDNDDAAGLRAPEIQVQLQRKVNDGEFVDYDEQTLSAANNWQHTWTEVSTAVGEEDGDITLYSYQVVEITDVPNYTRDVTFANNTYTVTNTLAVADLTITKALEDETGSTYTDANSTFTFDVTIDGSAYSGNYKVGTETKTASNGVITLKGGESAVIEGVTIGSSYKVTEPVATIPTGYVLKADPANASGTISAGGNTVEFTNVYTLVDLTIQKDIDNPDNNTADDVFTFKVTIGGEERTVNITGAGTETIPDIPYNTAYSIAEIDLPTGYTPPAAPANAEGNLTADTTVTFLNNYTTKDLTITKKIVDADGVEVTDANTVDDVFTFDVTLPAGTYTMGDGTFTSDGTAQEITITGQDSIVISGIPTGADYTVTEKSTTLPIGYELKETANASGKLDDHTEAVITNLYKTATLTISKTVEAKNIDTAKEFTFTVTLPNGTYSYTVGQETKTLTVANGTGTLTLKHDEIAVIAGVPVDASYKVAETADANYTTTVTGEESGTMTGNGATVAYTNIYKTGSLTISKEGIEPVDNHDASGDSKEEKQSTIYRVQGVANTATAGIDVTVVIYGNSSTTITNLPLGNYKVTELTDWAWRYTADAASQNAVVDVDGESVRFNNRRTNPYWLNGDNFAENSFNAYTPATTTPEQEVE